MIEFKTTKPRLSISFNDPSKIEVTLTAPKSYATEIESLGEDKELTVQIKQFTKKRSLNQNAYLWVLLDKIAEKVDRTKEEIYREFVKDYGVFQILPVKDEAKESFIAKWTKNGLGWITQELGQSKLKGYTNIIAYFGSSTYTTKEMTRLMDAVVRECEELGIATMTLDEILLLENDNQI